MKSIIKKVAGFALAAALALGMSGCSHGIDTHEHTFATTYTSNETHHWYAATCEHTTEVKDKAEHTFGEWTVTLPPTVTAEGKKERECSVCRYKAEETVAKLEIVKTPAFSVASGVVDSGTEVTITCTTEGAKIYYTTDGSNPTSSSTEYTAAISVTAAVTLKAIAVKDGMADSAVASASYTIKTDYSKCVVGDFILKDGTILSKDSTPTSGTVAAVIVRAASDDKPALGVGIVHSRSGLAWCNQYIDGSETTEVAGYNKNIEALKGDKTSGYIDGSDGWEKLKTACSDAAEHPEYYPAWKYCLEYASKNNLTGDLANGWYLPTVAELYTIYQNKTAVDASLSKADGSEFGTTWYWSCCQYPSDDKYARELIFLDGTMTGNYKINSDYVCSVRAFN